MHFVKPAMTFVGSESLDHHPPPSPSVHGHLLVSPTQRPLLSPSLLGSFLDEPDGKALGQGTLDEVREASPYTSASNESLHQYGQEKG